MIKMIVTDLDNTLLRTDKSISEYTVSILSKCRAEGIKTVFATARSKQAASRSLDMFAPDIFIGYGGSVAFAGEESLFRFDIPADISFRLIESCLRQPGVTRIHAINELVAHSNIEDPPDSDLSHYKYNDFAVNRGISYLKISVVADSPHVMERIASEYPMLDMLRYTGEDLYRFASRRAVKWNAVKAVAERYNIDTDMIAAFGDDVNDLEMIKHCGIGVAVENGIDEVKAAAKYICRSNDDDGVARWLEEHILPKGGPHGKAQNQGGHNR